jgi:hypothetical protein
MKVKFWSGMAMMIGLLFVLSGMPLAQEGSVFSKLKDEVK